MIPFLNETFILDKALGETRWKANQMIAIFTDYIPV